MQVNDEVAPSIRAAIGPERELEPVAVGEYLTSDES
jgi:hypothetical protein